MDRVSSIGPAGAARAAATMAWTVVERVLVRPVREGRLRVVGPRGYGAMVALGLLGVAAALALALLAPLLRDRLALVPTSVGVDAPSEPMGLLLALLVLAVALMHTAALHAPVWGRVAGIGMAVAYLSLVGFQGYRHEPALVLTCVAVATIVLLALQVLRWRARSAWWELVAVLATYGLATGVIVTPAARAGVVTGSGGDVQIVWLTLSDIAVFATPVIMVASLSVAQVGLRAAVWTARGVRVLAPLWLALLVCVAVLGFRTAVDVTGWLDTFAFSGTRIAGAAGFLAVCALVWGGVRWLGRLRPAPPLAVLAGDLTPLALPLAAVVSATLLLERFVLDVLLLPDLVADDLGLAGASAAIDGIYRATTAVTDALSSEVAGVIVTVLLLAVAAWLGSRGWPGPAGFVAVLAVVHGTSRLTGLVVPLYYLPLVLTGVAVLALVTLLVSGRLDARRLEALTMVGLLTTLLQVREVFDQPVALLLGSAAGVIAALVWAFLTGGGVTEEYRGRRSRAAWFLGYSLLGLAVLAFASLTANPDATFNPEAVSATGDEVFGTAILLTAVVACLAAVLRDRDLGELA